MTKSHDLQRSDASSNGVDWKPRFEFQQSSINNLAKEVRKLAVLGSAALTLVGWDGDATPLAGIIVFIVWALVQVVAMAIETIRVYPKSYGRTPSATDPNSVPEVSNEH